MEYNFISTFVRCADKCLEFPRGKNNILFVAFSDSWVANSSTLANFSVSLGTYSKWVWDDSCEHLWASPTACVSISCDSKGTDVSDGWKVSQRSKSS